MRAYECRYCGGWHYTTRRGEIEQTENVPLKVVRLRPKVERGLNGMDINDLPDKVQEKVRAQLSTFNENAKRAPTPEVNEAKKVFEAFNRLAEARSAMYGVDEGLPNEDEVVEMVADCVGKGPTYFRERVREHNLKRRLSDVGQKKTAEREATTQKTANEQILVLANENRDFVREVMSELRNLRLEREADKKQLTDEKSKK